MLGNCDIWAIVDFGNGPVEIRCTETGEHDQHRCEVVIIPEGIPENYEEPIVNNIFEQRSA